MAKHAFAIIAELLGFLVPFSLSLLFSSGEIPGSEVGNANGNGNVTALRELLNGFDEEQGGNANVGKGMQGMGMGG